MIKLVLIVIIVGIASQIPFILDEIKRMSTGEEFSISDKVELVLSVALMFLLVAIIMIFR